MKKIFLLITVFYSYNLYAQDGNNGSRISVGFNFSPDYNFRTIKRYENTSGIDLAIECRNNLEVPKIGYTAGLNLAINLSQNVAFETGFQYSEKGFQTKKSDLMFDPPTDPDNPPLLSTVKFHHFYQYFGVPLKVSLSFGEGDLRIISGIGVTTNFLLNAQDRTIIDRPNGKKKTIKKKGAHEYNMIDLSPIISLGIEYKLTNIINLRVEPTFRYGLIKINHSPIKENLWNAGVNFGVSYQL